MTPPALPEDDGAGVRRMSYELTPSEHDDDHRHAHEIGEQWERRIEARKRRSRLLALAAVCTMSIGSHLYVHPPPHPSIRCCQAVRWLN
jgi:hypothetical protein